MNEQRKRYQAPAVDLLLTPTDVIMSTLDQGGDDDEGMWQTLLNSAGFTRNV